MIAGSGGPSLEPVLERKIWTGESAQIAERDAQSLGGQCMIVGEVLRHHSRAVTRISDSDQSVFWLRINKGFEVVPLAGGLGVNRIVDQDGEVQRSIMAPIRDLDAFFAFKNLHIFFLNGRRSTLFRDGGHGESDRGGASGNGGKRSESQSEN